MLGGENDTWDLGAEPIFSYFILYFYFFSQAHSTLSVCLLFFWLQHISKVSESCCITFYISLSSDSWQDHMKSHKIHVNCSLTASGSMKYPTAWEVWSFSSLVLCASMRLEISYLWDFSFCDSARHHSSSVWEERWCPEQRSYSQSFHCWAYCTFHWMS